MTEDDASLRRRPPSRPLFQSFWMGGYEGADPLNRHGQALDMGAASGHLLHLANDHAAAAALGLRTIRESAGWRLCERPSGRFDFSRALSVARSASRHGLQVVWTLMHYGTPPDVSLLDDGFIERFARFCGAAAEALGPTTDAAPIYNPINEIGFLAWSVSETSDIWPYRADLRGSGAIGAGSEKSGYEVKRRLVRGVLAGMEAIRRADPRARFLHIEPVVHVVAPATRPDLAAAAERVRGYQWQTWDLIAGRAEPGLGGSLQALDRIGVNHYHSGQWEAATEARLAWHLKDRRRMPLRALLDEAWQRYRRPLLLAETSHFGAGRVEWLDEVASEVGSALAGGVPVEGICLYPIVDRPDWNDAGHWHHSGLWDVVPPADARAGRKPLERILHLPYARALARWQAQLPGPPGGR